MNESNDNSIELELQVRLLNLVLGEASDFERDQLQQLMEQRPELAVHVQHLEHLNGLLSEVGVGQWMDDNALCDAAENWQLSKTRRQHLLDVLDGTTQPFQALVTTAIPGRWKWLALSRWKVVALTSCAVTLLLAFLLLPGVTVARRLAIRLERMAGSESDSAVASAPVTDEELYDDDRIAFWQFSPAPGQKSSEMQGPESQSPSTKTPSLGKPLYKQPKPGSGQSDPELQVGQEGSPKPDVELSRGTGGFSIGGAVSEIEGGLGGVSEGRGGIGGTAGGGMGPVDPRELTLRIDRPSVVPQRPSLQDRLEIGDSLKGGTSEATGTSPADGSSIASQFDTQSQLGRRLSEESKTEKFYYKNDPASGLPKDSAGIELSDLASNHPFGQPSTEELPELLSQERANLDSNFAESSPQFGGFAQPRSQAPNLGLLLNVNPSIIVAEEEAGPLLDSNRDGFFWDEYGTSPHAEPNVASARDKEILDRKSLVGFAENSAAAEPFSTFSLHVSDVSFKLAQDSLGQGKMPEPDRIRIEEFVNALDYRDPLPTGNQKVACQVEQAIHPFLMQRNLLRVSLRTSASGRAKDTPLRLTLLLDNSGSMERPDRRQIVQQGLQSLVQQLSDSDQVTLISFASSPRLLADKVAGDQGLALQKIVENLPSEGGTNIEAALLLAGEKALEQKASDAQNRIVLLTDGAVNLGDADPNRLAGLVTQLRDLGIAFDAAGISSHGLNDQVLEALTRRGDGRYYLLDSIESAGTSFSDQIAGALRPTAKNVKVQVEFNPQRVGRYQLLGFEMHRLNKEDFRNDAVDAAELSAAESGVAIYHFEALANGSGDVGNVSVRFQDQDTGQMIEQRWPIPYEPKVLRLEQANPSMKIASVAALFATKLRGGPVTESIDLDELSRVLLGLPQLEANQPRVLQLRDMIQQAKGVL